MTRKICTIAALESLYGKPGDASLRKVSAALTPQYRALLEASPFFALATDGPSGLDVSPRGDPAPAVTVKDAQTLLIPDRRGNNRLDSLRNIVATGRAALLFLVPGCNETLRINGEASLTTDPDVLARFDMKGKLPVSVIEFEIAEIYFQCARALKRAELWNPATYRDRASLPSAGEMTKSAWAEFDAKTYDAELQDRQAKTLY